MIKNVTADIRVRASFKKAGEVTVKPDESKDSSVVATGDEVQLFGYIGMFTAYLKGVDAIVFTGGIGLGSSLIRKRVCEELVYMGLYLDEAANKKGTEGRISRKDSRISVYTWKTNEELMVARSCVRVLEDCEKKGKE